MRLERCDFTQAVRLLSGGGKTAISAPASTSALPTVPALRILSNMPLRHPALVGYLSSRGIGSETTSTHCREVHYAVDGRSYFAVGFRNDAGGWELRSERLKGCASPKQITTIDNRSNAVVAFEGFMDFLSYLSMKRPDRLHIDAVVLNSVANLPKAIPFLERHSTIQAFFDNDEAGRKVTIELKWLCPKSSVIDRSYLYQKHKDLSEYWQAKQPQLHIAPILKRGVKM